MADKKNALDELAERLDKRRWNLDVKDYDKAVLIVAELAKVKYKFIGDNLVARDFVGLENAFLKCRAIAEEGVFNGK